MGQEAFVFPVPLPNLCDQHRIVEELDDFQSRMVALRKWQAQIATELDALLPSILDKAFNRAL